MTDTKPRPQQPKPCGACPWRRSSLPGWLGASSPEGFVATLILDVEPLPCHSTIDYNRPDWHSRWMRGTDKRAKLCAGAAIAARNTLRCLKHHAPVEPDRETVFATFAEFIEHHRAAPVHSWHDAPPGHPERMSVDRVREYVGLPVLADSRTRKDR